MKNEMHVRTNEYLFFMSPNTTRKLFLFAYLQTRTNRALELEENTVFFKQYHHGNSYRRHGHFATSDVFAENASFTRNRISRAEEEQWWRGRELFVNYNIIVTFVFSYIYLRNKIVLYYMRRIIMSKYNSTLQTTALVRARLWHESVRIFVNFK